MDIMKEELVHHFSGAHIIADTHYEMANQIFKKIKKEKQIVFVGIYPLYTFHPTS
jgi:hypothetical protein